MIMPYNEIWVGVLCTRCGRPILAYNSMAWKRLTGSIGQAKLDRGSKFPLRCPDQNCSAQWDYQAEQFVCFRVEQIQVPG